MKKYEIHRIYVTQGSLFGMQEACFYYVHLLWIYVDDTLYIITRYINRLKSIIAFHLPVLPKFSGVGKSIICRPQFDNTEHQYMNMALSNYRSSHIALKTDGSRAFGVSQRITVMLKTTKFHWLFGVLWLLHVQPNLQKLNLKAIEAAFFWQFRF